MTHLQKLQYYRRKCSKSKDGYEENFCSEFTVIDKVSVSVTMRESKKTRELRERKINSILSGLQNVCCCLLIPFKAISSDVSVTQSANGHDNRDVLKLPHGISLCCDGLNLKNTKEMELVANPLMNPIFKLFVRPRCVCECARFVCIACKCQRISITSSDYNRML